MTIDETSLVTTPPRFPKLPADFHTRWCNQHTLNDLTKIPRFHLTEFATATPDNFQILLKILAPYAMWFGALVFIPSVDYTAPEWMVDEDGDILQTKQHGVLQQAFQIHEDIDIIQVENKYPTTRKVSTWLSNIQNQSNSFLDVTTLLKDMKDRTKKRFKKGEPRYKPYAADQECLYSRLSHD